MPRQTSKELKCKEMIDPQSKKVAVVVARRNLGHLETLD